MNCREITLPKDNNCDYTCILGTENYYFAIFSEDKSTFYCPVCETKDSSISNLEGNKFCCGVCNSKFEIIVNSWWENDLTRIKQIHNI